MVEVVDDYKPGDLVEAMCDEDQTWYTAVVQDSSLGAKRLEWCRNWMKLVQSRDPCEGEIWLRIRRSLGWSRWFTDKRLQAKIHDTWIFNLQNSHTGRKFLNLGEFGDLMPPILRHVLRKHIRFFSDYQVGDRVDARSETGVPQLLFKTHCSHFLMFPWLIYRSGGKRLLTVWWLAEYWRFLLRVHAEPI